MDDIDETLEMSIKNEKYSPALVHALTLGKRTLNKYYSQTDASELYHIALSMTVYSSLLTEQLSSIP